MRRWFGQVGRSIAVAAVFAGLAAAGNAPAAHLESASSERPRSLAGEPVSIVLLGTVLLGCAGIIRRRMA